MSELRDLPFEEQPEGIKDSVRSYWTKRADGFLRLRQDEIESIKAERWLKEIRDKLPDEADRKLKILDAGCGTGFFEVILGREGHEIVGIDLTEEMIIKARELIRSLDLDRGDVCARVGDAEHLDFENETFDAVITRNLTWTLPHPVTAYREWCRVLKKGGVLLNFDAEYAKDAHNLNSPDNLAHRDIESALKEECHDIYHMLTISNLNRPDWDLKILKEVGFSKAEADRKFSRRMFVEHDEFYIPDLMFEITAVK